MAGLFAQLRVAMPAPRTPHSSLHRISGTGIPPRSARFHFRRQPWEASLSIRALGLTLHPACAFAWLMAACCSRLQDHRRKASLHAFECICGCSPPLGGRAVGAGGSPPPPGADSLPAQSLRCRPACCFLSQPSRRPANPSLRADFTTVPPRH